LREFPARVVEKPSTAGTIHSSKRQYLSFFGRRLPVEFAAVSQRGGCVKLVRTAGVLGSLALVALMAGCGSKAHKAGHGAESATPAPAPPTPDTTPIEALRTPAGMVLKLDAPTPTPVPAK
jgi:hypothetical protein